MRNFVTSLFSFGKSKNRILPNVQSIKIVVVEFLEYGHHEFGKNLSSLLKKNKYFEVSYFNEPFNKNFLNLQGRNFFDLMDSGNTILQKLDADVVIWGYQENEFIRLNFQTAATYSDWNNVSCSVLDSLFVQAEHFETVNFFPKILENIIIGMIATSISEQRVDLRFLKQKLLRNVIDNFNTNEVKSSDSYVFSPYVLNDTGLIYLTYSQNDLSKKTFTTIKNLLDNALANKKQIFQDVHLGCIYKNLAQLYEVALKFDLDNHWVLFKEAISNYRLSQKYLNQYNYPYDYALISSKLSKLYFQYWKFTDDMQALRDAVYFLREAEKSYTKVSFPELWSQIEGYLGFYLSLIGSYTKNTDISMLAINSYKNKQIVYRKELYPVAWAKIQEDIASVYYNVAKVTKDSKAFTNAIEHYKSALKVYETKKLQKNIEIVNISLEKTMRAWRS